MNRRVWGAFCITGLILLCLFSQAQAGLLTKQDIEKLLEGQYIIGEIQAGMPAYPLFSKNPASPGGKPELKGYAFETLDFEPVRGYSGKPIDILVAMDLTGAFMDMRLIEHKEPFFNNATGTAKLADFTAQYIDLTLQHTVKVHDHVTPSKRDEQTADLQGVSHGTVTVKAIDRTVMGSASLVALAKLADSANGAAIARRRASTEVYKPLKWDVMLDRGMVHVTTITRRDIDRAFANAPNAVSRLNNQSKEQASDAALTFHTALVSLPAIGRNLLDSEGWRYLNTSRRQAQALLVTESGPLSVLTNEDFRVADALPFVLKQNGKTLKLHSIHYDHALNVPGYPKKTRAHFLVLDKDTPLDPGQSFELNFKLGQRFGTNQILSKVETREFDLPYAYNGWRAKFYNLVDTDWAAQDWVKVWQARWAEITALMAGLVILTIGLILQKRVSATSKRLRILRTIFLLYTLGFIGWYAQGQLTILNITAAINSLAGGGDLSFILNDPLTVILWIFTGITLLVWGRSTFCGWLCPFGALQELVSMLTNAIGIHQRRLRTVLDARLKWIKYGVLATIIVSLFAAPSFAELAVKIEPFETAISFYFMRDWPYIAWAATCLILGVFVYRGYCRYICPLGAALASVNFLQRWSWIPRRAECGQPCQSCRHRCEYQAISASGNIQYSECFQCLDCVSIYQDAQRCLPLINERKSEQRVITIHAAGRA